MTLMLASVAGLAEAEIALARGADIIDLKDRTKEGLGALESDLRAVVEAIGGRRPVCAGIGDPPMDPDSLLAAATTMAATGADYIKVALSPDLRRPDCIRALSVVAEHAKILGVMFADRGADEDLLALMAASGFAGVMLDTADKSGERLLDHRDIASLRGFITGCRDHGLTAGLAGALEAPDVPRLLLLEPDYLGFRSVLCVGGDRAAPINPEAITLIRDLIPLDPRTAPRKEGPAPDAGRGLSGRSGEAVDTGNVTGTDRVFVHDLVLPVRIGAYVHERLAPQNVRFNVDVKVRPGRRAGDMRDVFSYDVITDGIRVVVAREHVLLLETLAEQVAALVLADGRVLEVTVRVEKLETGAGAVGIEITRRRRGASRRRQERKTAE